jgi:hypothetical protein
VCVIPNDLFDAPLVLYIIVMFTNKKPKQIQKLCFITIETTLWNDFYITLIVINMLRKPH